MIVDGRYFLSRLARGVSRGGDREKKTRDEIQKGKRGSRLT
jgi:hypothetical protein